MNTYDLPIDRVPQHLQEIVMAIQEILAPDSYDFLLIGATARDLIISGKFDLGVGGATKDVDFAIYVPEWKSYHLLMDKLIGSGQFSRSKIQHRLMYMNSTEVDIVPFGEIQNEKGEYTWPPDAFIEMNVAGFIEINEHGILIKAQGTDLQFRIAPIEGICVMKIFAWKDRKHKVDKDAKDLGFILSNYLELKGDILYEEHEDIALDLHFDTIISVARVLGRDIANILNGNLIVLRKIKGIIEEELKDEDNSHLARIMAKGGGYKYEKSYLAIKSILMGIDDYSNKHHFRKI